MPHGIEDSAASIASIIYAAALQAYLSMRRRIRIIPRSYRRRKIPSRLRLLHAIDAYMRAEAITIRY